MNYILLSATLATGAIGAGIYAYLKALKKRIKRYVLRNEKIEKYFKDEL
jgi:hypothetical protein